MDNEAAPELAVLDASVAVRWLVTERGSDEAAVCMDRALAEREGAALATADARLASLARSRVVEVWKVPAA